MKIEMEKVFERDIDLLLINKFCNDKNIVEYFSSKINLHNLNVEIVQHSIMDENGESDVTIILNDGNQKIAFLIEDKIDAVAMPNQRDRYDIRGKNGIANGFYNKFYVFIVAPKDYLLINNEAKKYENQISYEKLIEIFKDDIYAKSLLEQAIEEKKKGYVIIENSNVTRFWKNYYEYINDNYSMLNINRVNGPRGSNANWPTFNTPIKQYKIRHKSDKGYMDLEFPKMAKNYFNFLEIVKNDLDEDMTVHVTSKSVSIRIIVPKIDFKQEFTNYMREMETCMESVIRLQELLTKLNLKEINSLPE